MGALEEVGVEVRALRGMEREEALVYLGCKQVGRGRDVSVYVL